MSSDPRPVVSVVVPIFDEERLLPQLFAALHPALARLGLAYEILYVDDGSRDRSLELLLREVERDEHVRVVELSRNWGHQAALSAGLAHARGDAVVLMDGDMQDPPEEIPRLVAAWQGGAQVVVAQRQSRRETGLRRLLIPLFYRLFAFLSDYPIPINAGIFGLLDRAAVDAIDRLSETNRYLPGLRAWVGFRTAIVFYRREARPGGEPKQSLTRLVRYGVDAIFGFSYKPLRLSLVLGSIVALFALLYGAVLTGCRLLGVGMFGIPVVDGYTSTIVSVLFLGGLQLLSVGVLGEYLGRIFDEVKRRPLFLVQKIHGRQDRE